MVKDWLDRNMITSMALDLSRTIWSSEVRSLLGKAGGEKSGNQVKSRAPRQCLDRATWDGWPECVWILYEGVPAWVERERRYLEGENPRRSQ